MKIRRKQRIRDQERCLTKKEKRSRLKNCLLKKHDIKRKQLQDELHKQLYYAKEQRKRAIYFWKKWKTTINLCKDKNFG